MPANHCFRCLGIAPASPRKKGWHSICTESGHTRICPKCTAEMGLPGPSQLPEREKKKVLTRKITKRALLNLLVKQGYLQHGQLVKADKQRGMVTIDKLELAWLPELSPAPYDLTENAVLSFEGLTDKLGPVYYRQIGACVAWLIWDIKGRQDLQKETRVKFERDGVIVLEG